jgi:hypothetical protein
VGTCYYSCKESEVINMAKNPPTGDGHRIGAVKDRTQTYNPKTEQWVKRDSDTGKFMDVKQDGKPFKGVTKEK